MSKLRKNREPTTALINIVFLMLIFFMVAGTLAPPLDNKLTLVETDALEGRAPPDALVLRADGTLRFHGEYVTLDSYQIDAATANIRLVPDRNASAQRLVEVVRALTAKGAEKVLIVTEQALK